MSTLLLVLLVPRFLPPTYVPLGLGLHKSMEMASSAMSQTLAGVWLDHAKEADSGEGREGGGGDGEDAGQETATKGLVRAWLFINVLQLVCVYVLWRFEKRRRSARETCSGSEGGTRRVGAEEGKASGRRYEAEEYERLPLNDLPALDSSDDDDSDIDDEDVRRSKLRMPSGAGSRAGGARGASVQGSDHEHQQQRLQAAADTENGPSSALARTDAERRRSRVFLVSSLGWIGLVWVVFLVDAYLDLF